MTRDDDTYSERDEASGSILRLVTLVVGSLQIILYALAANLLIVSAAPGQETAELEHALALLIPLFFLTLPGLLLAWLGRAPKSALALVVLAVPVALEIFH
jgi:hypothetical protein